jgi:phospholipid/cholesterol/gamma-HCH transport system substrate-binding protein
MSRGPRLEFAVGAFLLLALASLLVLAIASTNGKLTFGGAGTYELKARFANIGQLRTAAPVRIGGVNIGRVTDVTLDPVKLDSVLTLAIDDRYKDLPADTSAGIQTAGLLGESYIGLQPGGDVETLKPGDEIAFTTPAVDLMQLVGKYMFSGPGASSGANSEAPAAQAPAAEESPSTDETTEETP